METEHDDTWEVVEDYTGRLMVQACSEEDDHYSAEVYLDEILHSLTDEQRKTLFSEFCGHCGRKNSPCYCQNDE